MCWINPPTILDTGLEHLVGRVSTWKEVKTMGRWDMSHGRLMFIDMFRSYKSLIREASAISEEVHSSEHVFRNTDPLLAICCHGMLWWWISGFLWWPQTQGAIRFADFSAKNWGEKKRCPKEMESDMSWTYNEFWDPFARQICCLKRLLKKGMEGKRSSDSLAVWLQIQSRLTLAMSIGLNGPGLIQRSQLQN